MSTTLVWSQIPCSPCTYTSGMYKMFSPSIMWIPLLSVWHIKLKYNLSFSKMFYVSYLCMNRLDILNPCPALLVGVSYVSICIQKYAKPISFIFVERLPSDHERGDSILKKKQQPNIVPG